MGLEINKQAGVELSNIAVSDTHGEDSPYFAGWKAYDEDPYHPFDNPSGVIQMGLAENQVSNLCIYIYIHTHYIIINLIGWVYNNISNAFVVVIG